MTTKEFILNFFKKVFINTNIPCNSLFISSINEHVGVECEIVERTENYVTVRLLFSDEPLLVKCTFRDNNNVTKYVSKIELI